MHGPLIDERWPVVGTSRRGEPTVEPIPSECEFGTFSMLADGLLDHPECVAVGPDGALYAGGEDGQVYRVTLDGAVHEVAHTGGIVQGLCLDGHGNLYVCDVARHEVLRVTQEGTISVYASGTDERAMVAPNYCVFDSAGHLYVSDSGVWSEDNGCVCVVRPDGSTRVLTDELRQFPNGLALDADEINLYVVLSTSAEIVRLPVRKGCSAGPAEPAVSLPADVVPDGLAFDMTDTLYISCYTPDRIYTWSRDRGLQQFAEDRRRTVLNSPTNVAFAGPDRTVLVAANLGGRHLAVARVRTSGRAYRYPKPG